MNLLERPAKPNRHPNSAAPDRPPLSPDIAAIRMAGRITSGVAKLRDYGQTRQI